MAASDHRRQPENPEGEQRTPPVRQRPPLGREPQKQPPGQEVTRRVPERPLRPSRLRSHLSAHEGSEMVANFRWPTPKENWSSRRVQRFAQENNASVAGKGSTKPEPLGTVQPSTVASLRPAGRLASGTRRERRQMSMVPSLPASAAQTPIRPKSVRLRQQSIIPSPRQLTLRRTSFESSSRQPTFKETRRQALPNFNPKEYRTQESGYTPTANQPGSRAPINPWAVNPNSNPPLPQTSPYPEGDTRGIRNPKLIDTSRRRNGYRSFEAQTSVNPKNPTPTSNRQRERSRSRRAATVPSGSSPQSSQSKKNQTARRLQKRPVSPLVYIVRLLILGIGIGAIAGTIVSALDPATQASVKTQDTTKTQIQESPSRVNRSLALPLSQEISPLKAKIQALVAQNPQLQPGVFIIDLDTGMYLDWEGNSSLAAASTIKLPILVAFLQDVDAGKVRLDETLTLKPEMIVGGSGELQYKQPGTQYTALEVVKKMITISDNTATNMLIARLGGIELLNQRFRSWGLTTTVLRNPLPDIEGTNTTSPKELATVLSLVNRGELVSLESRDRMLDIMQQTQLNTLLPKGLGAGATIAHKTGTIGSLLADVGLVDMPTGKRYIIAVMVKRSRNDPTAEDFIRQISRTTYDYFNQPRATPSATSMPIGSTATLTRALTPENFID